MKHIFIAWVFVASSLACSAQAEFLSLSRDRVEQMLRERGVEFMVLDSDYVNTVDDWSLRNIIAYFSRGVCNRVTITFQSRQDFDRVVRYMDAKYPVEGFMTWMVETKAGTGIVTGSHMAGYDEIEERLVREDD